MLSFLVGAIGAIIGLVGWYSSQSIVCLILGAIAYAIESVLEEDKLTSKAKVDLYIAFGIGAVFVPIRGANPWYIGGLLGINLWNGVLTIFGIIYYILFFASFKDKH